MATVSLRLLGVLLFLTAANAFRMHYDLDVAQLGGKWYQTGVAAHPRWIKNNVWLSKVSKAFITPEDGGLHVNRSLIIEETGNPSCLRAHSFLEKTSLPGLFVVHDKDPEAINELQILEVNSETYIIGQNKWSSGDSVVLLNNLYTREPEVSPEIGERFTEASKTVGQITFLPMKGECI